MNLWEKAITLAASNFLSKGDVVLDVGSNIGGVACNFSDYVQETGKVICFEANSELKDWWVEETSKSKFRNLELVLRAAWNTTRESLKLSIDDSFYKSASSIFSDDSDARFLFAQSLAIDDYVFQPVALIKMDIEGAEYEALDGAKGVIAESRPVIILECELPPKRSERNPLLLLGDWNYEFYSVNTYHKVLSNDTKEPGLFNILALPKERNIVIEVSKICKRADQKNILLSPGKYSIKVTLTGEKECSNGIGLYNLARDEYEIYYMANVGQLQHSTNSSLPIYLEHSAELQVRMTKDCEHSHISSIEVYRVYFNGQCDNEYRGVISKVTYTSRIKNLESFISAIKSFWLAIKRHVLKSN